MSNVEERFRRFQAKRQEEYPKEPITHFLQAWLAYKKTASPERVLIVSPKKVHPEVQPSETGSKGVRCDQPITGGEWNTHIRRVKFGPVAIGNYSSGVIYYAEAGEGLYLHIKKNKIERTTFTPPNPMEGLEGYVANWYVVDLASLASILALRSDCIRKNKNYVKERVRTTVLEALHSLTSSITDLTPEQILDEAFTDVAAHIYPVKNKKEYQKIALRLLMYVVLATANVYVLNDLPEDPDDQVALALAQLKELYVSL